LYSSQRDKKMKKQLLISLLVVGLLGSWALFAMEAGDPVVTEASVESRIADEEATQKELISERNDANMDNDSKRLVLLDKAIREHQEHIKSAKNLLDQSKNPVDDHQTLLDQADKSMNEADSIVTKLDKAVEALSGTEADKERAKLISRGNEAMNSIEQKVDEVSNDGKIHSNRQFRDFIERTFIKPFIDLFDLVKNIKGPDLKAKIVELAEKLDEKIEKSKEKKRSKKVEKEEKRLKKIRTAMGPDVSRFIEICDDSIQKLIDDSTPKLINADETSKALNDYISSLNKKMKNISLTDLYNALHVNDANSTSGHGGGGGDGDL
jgi:hypothetical protein